MKNVTKEQVNEWYKKSLNISDHIYSIMEAAFNENNIVSYSVTVNRWDDHITIDIFMTIGYGSVCNELRELAGNVTSSFTFASYKENVDEEKFIESATISVKEFKHKAEIVKQIVDKNNS